MHGRKSNDYWGLTCDSTAVARVLLVSCSDPGVLQSGSGINLDLHVKLSYKGIPPCPS